MLALSAPLAFFLNIILFYSIVESFYRVHVVVGCGGEREMAMALSMARALAIPMALAMAMSLACSLCPSCFLFFFRLFYSIFESFSHDSCCCRTGREREMAMALTVAMAIAIPMAPVMAKSLACSLCPSCFLFTYYMIVFYIRKLLYMIHVVVGWVERGRWQWLWLLLSV